MRFFKKSKKNVFVSRGDSYLDSRDYNAAIVMFTEALNQTPADITILTRRSLAYAFATPQRLDLALQDAEAAVQHGPRNWRAWLQKGDVLLLQGNTTLAEQAVLEAIRLAKGEDKLTAQRSLANVQARRSQTSSEQPVAVANTNPIPVNPMPSVHPPPPSNPFSLSPYLQSPITPPVSFTTSSSGTASYHVPALPVSSSSTSPETNRHASAPVTNTTPSVPLLVKDSGPAPVPSSPLASTARTIPGFNPILPRPWNLLSPTTPPVSSTKSSSGTASYHVPALPVSSSSTSPETNRHASAPVTNTTPSVPLLVKDSGPAPVPSSPLASTARTIPGLNPILPRPWNLLSPTMPPVSSTKSSSGTASYHIPPLSVSSSPTASAPAPIFPRPLSTSPSSPGNVLNPFPTPSTSNTTIRPRAVESDTPSRSNPTRTQSVPGQILVIPQSTANVALNQGGVSRSTTNQQEESTTVTRTHDAATVSTAPVLSVPLTSEDLIDLTPEAPPSYLPSFNSTDPTVRALSQQAIETQLTQLETTLAVKNRGSISIRPYTAAGLIDAVKLVYVGMTQLELTSRELGTPTYLHRSFGTMAMSMLDYPGTTFHDLDCESSGYYDGKLAGTVSILGFSEEYRQHQFFKHPMLNIVIEGKEVIPPMTLDKVVDRIRILQLQPTLEDPVALRDILGLSQLTTLQYSWNSTNGRQRQIETICMALTRSLYEAPTRFLDFSKARNVTNNTLGTRLQGIGLENFLFQILIGAELLIRLRKEPITTSYSGLMTDSISSLVLLSALWMANVTIQGPTSSTTTTNTLLASIIPPSPRYKLIATQYQTQVEGLIRFGEALSWPHMDEARHYIEHAYQDLIIGKGVFGFDICDWLYGLILPGKIFRHRIMACLVAASPSIRSIGAAPFWDNGLVIKNKSYWPRRSVLGRVLGGLKNPKSVCGWIGPVPAPKGDFQGWIRLSARRVDIPVPVNTAQTTLRGLGFGERDATESSEAFIQSLTDANEWIQASPPTRPANDTSTIAFEGIQLTEMPSLSSLTTGASLSDREKEYQASLEFKINGTLTRYTLYSNPLFVYAPPCVGTHSVHRRQASNYLNNFIPVADLKDAYPESDSLLVIDATGKGEEVVARAWCAERGKHAVVRRDGECCFACAVNVTMERTGLGFNVLIWSL